MSNKWTIFSSIFNTYVVYNDVLQEIFNTWYACPLFKYS